MPPANAWLGGTVSSLSFAPVAYAPGSPERDRVSVAEQLAHPNNSAKAGSSARVLARSTALPYPSLQNPSLSADVKPQSAPTSRPALPGKKLRNWIATTLNNKDGPVMRSALPLWKRYR